jgi:hypothetical protein
MSTTNQIHPRLLLLVDCDPQTSSRPAEAIRVAAGVGAWQNVHVQLCLAGPASLMAGCDFGEFRDGDELDHYLKIIQDRGDCVWVVMDGQGIARDKGNAGPVWRWLSMAELAAEAARMDWVSRF